MFASLSATSKLDGPTSERLVATEDSFERTEPFDGVPVEKPSMSGFHGDLGGKLGFVIRSQIDPDRYRLRSTRARLALPEGGYSIPDIAIVPNTPPESVGDLDPYRQPVPLVVEIRSPSTSGYDASVKLPGYRLRGDAEVWWLYLQDRTLTVGSVARTAGTTRRCSAVGWSCPRRCRTSGSPSTRSSGFGPRPSAPGTP